MIVNERQTGSVPSAVNGRASPRRVFSHLCTLFESAAACAFLVCAVFAVFAYTCGVQAQDMPAVYPMQGHVRMEGVTEEGLFAELELSEGERALWMSILDAYASGRRGEAVFASGLSVDEIRNLFTNANKVQGLLYAGCSDGLQDAVIGIGIQGSSVSVHVDMDVLSEKLDVSADNELQLERLLVKALPERRMLTERETLERIQNVVCSTITYDSMYQRYSLSDALAGNAVCAGYTRLFQGLCLAAGIPCAVECGYSDAGEYHAWNAVRLDGRVFYIDATWDDTESSSCRKSYFLLDEDAFFAEGGMPG